MMPVRNYPPAHERADMDRQRPAHAVANAVPIATSSETVQARIDQLNLALRDLHEAVAILGKTLEPYLTPDTDGVGGISPLEADNAMSPINQYIRDLQLRVRIIRSDVEKLNRRLDV